MRFIIALYLFIGGIIFLVLFIYKSGVFGFLSSLVPSFITILVLLFFIFSGAHYFRYRNSGTLLKASMLIQAFQISILGINFKNFFGPYIAMGFTYSSDFEVMIDYEAFTFLFANGFRISSNELSLMINMPALIIVVLLIVKENNIKRTLLADESSSR
jgi:hypothetical protein